MKRQLQNNIFDIILQILPQLTITHTHTHTHRNTQSHREEINRQTQTNTCARLHTHTHTHTVLRQPDREVYIISLGGQPEQTQSFNFHDSLSERGKETEREKDRRRERTPINEN